MGTIVYERLSIFRFSPRQADRQQTVAAGYSTVEEARTPAPLAGFDWPILRDSKTDLGHYDRC